VTISLKGYLHLIGVACSRELREKLDRAFYLCENRDEARYAEISHRFDGECPLRREDGLCALHAELGEESLPTACRAYPRAVKGFAGEVSCANSCERVVELLIGRRTPLRFFERALSVEGSIGRCDDPDARWGRDVRAACVAIMQRRALSLPERLALLGRFAEVAEACARDDLALRAALRAFEAAPAPRLHADAEGALRVQRALAAFFADSASVGAACARALGALDAPEAYRERSARFERTHPIWSIWLEQLMVNHIFFSGYPFEADQTQTTHTHLSLCAAYALLRFLMVGLLADEAGEEPFVDLMSAAFRLIEHSAFDQNAATVLRAIGLDGVDPLLIQ
jgi:hypothetical protein